MHVDPRNTVKCVRLRGDVISAASILWVSHVPVHADAFNGSASLHPLGIERTSIEPSLLCLLLFSPRLPIINILLFIECFSFTVLTYVQKKAHLPVNEVLLRSDCIAGIRNN